MGGYLGCFFIKKGTMIIIDEVKLNDGSYSLILSTPHPNSNQANSAKKKNSIDECHHKLGHLSRNHLSKFALYDCVKQVIWIRKMSLEYMLANIWDLETLKHSTRIISLFCN